MTQGPHWRDIAKEHLRDLLEEAEIDASARLRPDPDDQWDEDDHVAAENDTPRYRDPWTSDLPPAQHVQDGRDGTHRSGPSIGGWPHSVPDVPARPGPALPHSAAPPQDSEPTWVFVGLEHAAAEDAAPEVRDPWLTDPFPASQSRSEPGRSSPRDAESRDEHQPLPEEGGADAGQPQDANDAAYCKPASADEFVEQAAAEDAPQEVRDPWLAELAPVRRSREPSDRQSLDSPGAVSEREADPDTGDGADIAVVEADSCAMPQDPHQRDAPRPENGAANGDTDWTRFDHAGLQIGYGRDWEDLEAAEDDLIGAQTEFDFGFVPGALSGTGHDMGPDGTSEPDEEDAETEKWRDEAEAVLVDDGWDEAAAVVAPYDAPHDPLVHEAGDYGIDEFDPDAQQLLWEMPPDDEEGPRRRAREKAATVASALEVESIAERDRALDYLTELFEHLAHPATFAAIANATDRGLDLPTLKSMVALRQAWMERPEWWVERRYGEIRTMRHGQSAMTWVLAQAVCDARPEYDPELMIDEEWIDEWLSLPHGAPGYLNFPSFVAVKVDNLEADALHAGFDLLVPHNGGDHFGNDYGWYRRIPDPHEAVRLGFRVRTPFDNREYYVSAERITKIGETES